MAEPMWANGTTFSPWVTWQTTTNTSTTMDVWTLWQNTTGASNIWPMWIASGTNTSTYTVNTSPVWDLWQHMPQEQRDAYAEQHARYAEQRAAQQAEQNARYAAAERVRLEADARAEELLREHLSPEQQAELDRDKRFHVIAPSGKKYRIERGRSGNVRLVEGERLTTRYCIHPREAVPNGDTMLAQKFMLETDEHAFLRIANAS